jgi:hypothetical protein
VVTGRRRVKLMKHVLMKAVEVVPDAELEDDDGALTPKGMDAAHRYAMSWLAGTRDLELERRYASLAGLLSDIRSDPDLAQRHATVEAADAWGKSMLAGTVSAWEMLKSLKNWSSPTQLLVTAQQFNDIKACSGKLYLSVEGKTLKKVR